MRPGDAEARGCPRISDLAPRAATCASGSSASSSSAQDGLPGLVHGYGLRFARPPREMDLGLLYARSRRARSTWSSAARPTASSRPGACVVLEDDRRYFPPYDAVPIANAASLDRHRGLREALESLAGTHRRAAMRRLNHAVDGEHRAARDVAREFLAPSRTPQ